MAKFWSNLGQADIDYSIRFSGISITQNPLVIVSTSFPHRHIISTSRPHCHLVSTLSPIYRSWTLDFVIDLTLVVKNWILDVSHLTLIVSDT